MSLSLRPLSEKKTKKKKKRRMNAIYSRGQRREKRERKGRMHSLTKESKLYLPNRPFDASHNGSFTTTGQFRKTDRYRKTDQSPQRVSSVKRISSENGLITNGSGFHNGSANVVDIKSHEPSLRSTPAVSTLMLIVCLTLASTEENRSAPLSSTTTDYHERHRESLSSRRRWFVRFAIDNA
jgi:hypothetical protein